MEMFDQKRIYAMARHIAFKNALHECPEEVARDLCQAAWVQILQGFKNIKFAWRDIEYAMREELSRWLYQCKRGRGKTRNLSTKHELREWVGGADWLTPERFLIIREDFLAFKPNKGGRPKKNAHRGPESRGSQISDPNLKSKTCGEHSFSA